MKTNEKKKWMEGGIFLALFLLWTALIQTVDVKPIGPNETCVGFSALNSWFHDFTDVNLALYTITDWLGLVPLFICMVFAGIGFVQMIVRRSLFRVDADILILGAYYIAVIFCYVIFEMVSINYRPILIDGRLEASYPSSTTLLVMGVMPTLVEQGNRRAKNKILKHIILAFAVGFSAFMVVGRLICGVHWLTDIVGSVLLCAGLFAVYKGAVLLFCKKT